MDQSHIDVFTKSQDHTIEQGSLQNTHIVSIDSEWNKIDALSDKSHIAYHQ